MLCRPALNDIVALMAVEHNIGIVLVGWVVRQVLMPKEVGITGENHTK